MERGCRLQIEEVYPGKVTYAPPHLKTHLESWPNFRCGVGVVPVSRSFTETAADSAEMGVLSHAAGRRPAICHTKPGTSTKGPEGSGPVTTASRNIPDFLFLEVVGRQEVDWRSGEAATHTFTVRMSRGECGADSQAKTTVT
ncbi:hypothetical protein QQF64_020763 [Cirrhinus molitorella]|uniref:Uncharacterized protein n=1 Tax=Cirrhinus molitorella TaxID=172907 RepID=A0ABR3LA82_9TELE